MAAQQEKQPRGIYALDDEEAPWLRERLVFPSKEECTKWMTEHIDDRDHPSNPMVPHLEHIFCFLTTWEEVEKYMLTKMAEYDRRFPPRPVDPGYMKEHPTNVFFVGDKGSSSLDSTNPVPPAVVNGVLSGLKQRLDLPFHQSMNRESVRNTLKYLFNHMRHGIYVMIRHGKVRMFVPFVNSQYRNSWGGDLKWRTPGDGLRRNETIEEYYDEKIARTRKEENFIPQVDEWWANGNIICNVHKDKNEPQSQYWGDQFLAPLRDMLHQLCEQRPDIPDCEFFINKRDYPHLKVNTELGIAVEPYGFIFDRDDRDPKQDIPLSRESYPTYAPIASFYCGAPDRFADLPIPTSEDWEAATGKIYPPSFRKEFNGALKNPRDLFTEENFRKFECDWSEKQETALFRGTATGGGVTADTNQRIKVSALSHEWKSDDTLNGQQDGTQVPYLDAAITGWNHRCKKTFDRPMTYVDHTSFPFQGGKQNFIPIFKQSRYKYLLYIDGHCAACRYAFMMRLGSVILKVESQIVADTMWYFPLLRPWVDHVPVAPDLSDLKEKIAWCRAHDAECRQIARNAAVIYERYLSEQGALDYLQMMCFEIASRWQYPSRWWTAPPPARPPPAINAGSAPPLECFRGDLCSRCKEEKVFKESLERASVAKPAENDTEAQAIKDEQRRKRKEKMRNKNKRKLGD